MIKPIPLSLLGDSVTYLETKDGRWGQSVASEVEVRQVSVQAISAISKVKSQQNESNSYQLLLFFDCVNSLPKWQTFKLDDRIRYEGETYRIAKVEVIKTFDGQAHHIEVMLE